MTNGYDGANRIIQVSGAYGGPATSYVSQLNYSPQNTPNSYYYANNVARTYTYNSRLQPGCMWDAVNNDPKFYLFSTCPNWGGSNNNGNLQGNTQSEGGPGPLGTLTTYQDSFSYDGANRLTSGTESSPSCGGTCWTRTHQYDAFGNMWVTSNGGLPNVTGPTSNVFNSSNQISGVQYDPAGNQLIVNGNTLNYDAENRQISATEPPSLGGGTESYFYDGKGQRVEKSGPSGTIVYVYDAFGRLAAEYSDGPTVTPACQTCYLSYDHLGTVRMVTDATAQVIARHDYVPFGEEILPPYAGRGASQSGISNFGAPDSVSQRFTGQFRDSETGEDFFNARYFTGTLGRFNSPDPGNAGASPANPQDWNAYSYVGNNPLNATDPAGLARIDQDGLNLIRADLGLGQDPWTGGCAGGFLACGGGQLQNAEQRYENQLDAGFYANLVGGYLANDDSKSAQQVAQLGGYQISDVSSTFDGQTTHAVTVYPVSMTGGPNTKSGNAEPTTPSLNIDVKGLLGRAGTAICGSQRSTGEQVFTSVRNGTAKGLVGGALNGAGAPAIPLLIPNIMGSLELGAEAGVVGGPVGMVTGALIGGAAGAASGVVIGFAKSAACSAAGF